MNLSGGNRFEDFFADDAYVSLKNHLYNYLLRRHAIRKCLQFQKGDLILEVGSGLSPMMDDSERVVYSELSFPALRTLKRRQGRGYFVVADATHLPFKAGSFSQVICSEVLEHLPEDRPALRDIASVMKPAGSLILTFPHRRFYFSVDDRFVNHFRRYELNEMEANLKKVGLETVEVRKVLGPLEKITMLMVISLISVFGLFCKGKRNCGQGVSSSVFVVTVFQWLNRLYCVPIWLDARLSPRCLSTVLLLRAIRRN
ncbi:MAG: class I SAM-dependent methyltransferase [Syntrophales bacterium]|nr:class I SAM-dependent methyltransferase [Syntrophales bacterium]